MHGLREELRPGGTGGGGGRGANAYQFTLLQLRNQIIPPHYDLPLQIFRPYVGSETDYLVPKLVGVMEMLENLGIDNSEKENKNRNWQSAPLQLNPPDLKT